MNTCQATALTRRVSPTHSASCLGPKPYRYDFTQLIPAGLVTGVPCSNPTCYSYTTQRNSLRRSPSQACPGMQRRLILLNDCHMFRTLRASAMSAPVEPQLYVHKNTLPLYECPIMLSGPIFALVFAKQSKHSL